MNLDCTLHVNGTIQCSVNGVLPVDDLALSRQEVNKRAVTSKFIEDATMEMADSSEDFYEFVKPNSEETGIVRMIHAKCRLAEIK